MRTLALVIAIGLVAGYAAVRLYAVHTAASVTLARCCLPPVAYRDRDRAAQCAAPVGATAQGRDARQSGHPEAPKGAPYRGPH